MRADYKALVRLWEQVDPEKKSAGRLSDMGRHIGFGQENDFNDILTHDLPDVQRNVEKLAKTQAGADPVVFENLLHPLILEKCVPLYRDGHLRESVLNAVIAVYDLIRQRTQSNLDGSALAGQAFGLDNGKLIFSEIDTDTGQNDQKGFLQIFQGVYTGAQREVPLPHPRLEPSKGSSIPRDAQPLGPQSR